MSWDNILHKRLRDICAYLWPDPRDCKRLVADALIDSSRINWDDPPVLRWQDVIMECDKQRALHKLCPVLLDEYPENPQLREAVAPWMDNASGEAEPKPVVKKPVELPVEYLDSAEEMPVILEAIRADLGRLYKQVEELRHWRIQSAVLAAKNFAGEEEDNSSNFAISLPAKKED